ncbi:MAG: hypothetical protein AAF921_03555 [Cyanobacteria bacterium P01_D01_bin.44]
MSDRLYNLLPTMYRQRDVAEGEPLRALLAIMERELVAVEDDIGGLYENWFIETCDEWVVPYIGELLGVRGLNPETNQVVSQRPHVANAIGYRRRKGVTAILEQVAEDITGWKARAVEYFKLLGATQHLDHLRPISGRTFDLRDRAATDLLNTPFRTASSLVDVRRITSNRGLPNIPNIGLFLWRWSSYPLSQVMPNQDQANGYTIHPLGYDCPLFSRPQIKRNITERTEAIHVPTPLSRQMLMRELSKLQAGQSSDYFGVRPVFRLWIDGKPVAPANLAVADLSEWPIVNKITLDPELGRLALPPGLLQIKGGQAGDGTSGEAQLKEVQASDAQSDKRLTSTLEERVPGQDASTESSLATGSIPHLAVDYAYGFSADIGGGPYDRRTTLSTATDATWQAVVSQNPSPGIDLKYYADLTGALAAWHTSKRTEGQIRLLDNGTYAIGNLTVLLPDQAQLAIEAADGVRPCLRGTITVIGQGKQARFTLNGLLLDGGIHLNFQGNLRLNIIHCTLMPFGVRTISAPRAAMMNQVVIRHSIIGALRLPTDMAGLVVRDSIIGPTCSINQRAVLVSGPVNPDLTTSTPSLNVKIGDSTRRVVLAESPSTAAQVRDQLQAAIRAANQTPAWSQVQVILTHSPRRLVVLSGTDEAVTIAPTDDDPDSAVQLGLDASKSRQAKAVCSGLLEPFPTLQAEMPTINVAILSDQGHIGPRRVTLDAVPTTLAQARDQLQDSIRLIHSDPAIAEMHVAALDDRLLFIPGPGGQALRFGPTAADASTVQTLDLVDPVVIAAPNDSTTPGPTTTLERVSVFGSMTVKTLASTEVIFTAPVQVKQQQEGYVRFSYVPSGSQTPQRYRCQPDLALAIAAQAKGEALSSEEKHAILLRIQPRLTDRTYAQPGYGQLSDQCPIEIATGAENGSEMGAFQHLLQPQRMANLRNGLEEYLRAGMEAGIFLVN